MSDRLTDDEMMKMVREQADELESCAAAMRAAGAEIDRLRLALETATRERDEARDRAETWSVRAAAHRQAAAAAEAEVARLSVELTVAGETLLKHNHDWSDRCEAAEAEVARLREALTTINLMRADDYYGPYSFTYAMEAKRVARAALEAPRNAAQARGEEKNDE